MPDEPPRDEEADFLDFLRDDDSPEDDEPPKPVKGQEGDLVVLEPGATPGEGSDDFREAEEKASEPGDAPGEKFSDEVVPSAEEAGSDELLGWLDDAAKDSLEGPKVEEMMTQEMEELGDEPMEAEVAEEIEEEADIIFGGEDKAPPDIEQEKIETEELPTVKKQSFDDLREEDAAIIEDQPSGPMDAVGEEAAAEFDALLDDSASAPEPEPVQSERPGTARVAGGESLFRLEDGTPIPALPAQLGGFSPPTQPEFRVRKIRYPEVRTPLPVSFIILLILIVVAIGAGYYYRAPIKTYVVGMWDNIFKPTEVTPPGTGGGTATDIPETGSKTSTGGSTDQGTIVPPKNPNLHEITLNKGTTKEIKYTFSIGDKKDVEAFMKFIREIQLYGIGADR
ncbi:MAG: hypothetical protein ACYS8W_06730 [Planctomycetota bacterium]|jgi:hypothetical protein